MRAHDAEHRDQPGGRQDLGVSLLSTGPDWELVLLAEHSRTQKWVRPWAACFKSNRKNLGWLCVLALPNCSHLLFASLSNV